MTEVHLAWNDDTGEFCGEIFAAEFFGPDGHLLTLQGDPIVGDRIDMELVDPERRAIDIVLADGDIRLRGKAWRCWAGNMAWDSVQMEGADALRLASILLGLDFVVTEVVSEEPWASVEARR